VKAVKDKKDSVLSKHKRWLSQLQKMNQEKEEKCALEAQRKEDLRKRLAQSAQKHDISRFLSASDFSSKMIFDADGKPETTMDVVESKSMDASDAKAERKHIKPAWAQSSKDVESALDNDENMEIDSLLDFANNLDFEKYVNDIEVKSMITLLQKRIAGLEKDIATETQVSESIVNQPKLAEKKVLSAIYRSVEMYSPQFPILD
jgi:hypothetical protein